MSFSPSRPPSQTLTLPPDLDSATELVFWSQAEEKRRGEWERKRLLYAECSVALRGQQEYSWHHLFQVCWFSHYLIFPLCFSFLGSVFTRLVFAHENAVITSLALNKTLIFFAMLRRNLCKLRHKSFWHLQQRTLYSWALLLTVLVLWEEGQSCCGHLSRTFCALKAEADAASQVSWYMYCVYLTILTNQRLAVL